MAHSSGKRPLCCASVSSASLGLALALGIGAGTPPRGAAAGPDTAAGAEHPATVEPQLAGLLRSFAAMPGMEARFVERKKLALLVAPIESSGTLYYARPNLLARYTTSPVESVAIVTDGRLRFGDGDSLETLDFDSAPPLRAFFDSLLELLRGDISALEAVFEIDYRRARAEPDGWRMILTPAGEPLARLLARIELTGRATAVRSMRLTEPDGDETTTTFSQVDRERRFSDDEKRRLFHLVGPR